MLVNNKKLTGISANLMVDLDVSDCETLQEINDKVMSMVYYKLSSEWVRNFDVTGGILEDESKVSIDEIVDAD